MLEISVTFEEFQLVFNFMLFFTLTPLVSTGLKLIIDIYLFAHLEKKNIALDKKNPSQYELGRTIAD